jgi:hypothetical protein
MEGLGTYFCSGVKSRGDDERATVTLKLAVDRYGHSTHMYVEWSTLEKEKGVRECYSMIHHCQAQGLWCDTGSTGPCTKGEGRCLMYCSVCFWIGMVRWTTTSSSQHASPVTSRSMQVQPLSI